MCKPHWFMVPKKLRDALWDAYVPGQEIRKDPSPEYLIAANRCICAVAVKEGRMTQEQADAKIAAKEHSAKYEATLFPVIYSEW